LHPQYLDPQGLVALWREALLARAVLRGNTRGYRQHPQLERFQTHASPLTAINAYLAAVHAEASRRGYAFDAAKLVRRRTRVRLTITTGQLEYEGEHLSRKLRARNPTFYRMFVENCATDAPRPHPLFRVVAGAVQSWERVSKSRPHALVSTPPRWRQEELPRAIDR
jgi:hypothetical protein